MFVAVWQQSRGDYTQLEVHEGNNMKVRSQTLFYLVFGQTHVQDALHYPSALFTCSKAAPTLILQLHHAAVKPRYDAAGEKPSEFCSNMRRSSLVLTAGLTGSR